MMSPKSIDLINKCEAILEEELQRITLESLDFSEPTRSEYLYWNLTDYYKKLLIELRKYEKSEDYEGCIAIRKHLENRLSQYKPKEIFIDH